MVKRKELAVLAGIILIAFALRILTYKYYLMGYDPFHHYKIAEYIAENGEFPKLWHLSVYPEGATIIEPMGLYYVSVFLYKVLEYFGLSFLGAFKLSTPVFGSLTLIPAYLLTRHVFSTRAAFYAAAILAVLPAFSYRTFAGFYRGDAFSVFFMLLGFYFFLLSLGRKSIKFSLPAGISLGCMGLVWNGFVFGFVALSGFVVLCSLLNYIQAKSSKLLLSYAIAAGLGIAIIKYSIVVQPHAQNYIQDLIRYIYPATLLFIATLEILKTKTRLETKHRAYLLLFITAISGAAALKFFPQFLKNLITGYGLVKPAEILLQTITELQPTTLDSVWIGYYIASAIFVIGLLYLFKEFYKNKSEKIVFTLLWTFTSLYLLKMAVRYSFLVSIPVAVVCGFFLEKISIQKLQVKKLPKLVAVLLLLGIALNGIAFAGSMKPHMSEEWYDALTFLKEEEGGAVLSWWSYGSWIQGVTGFPTLTDTVHGQGIGIITEVGRIFVETNESKTLDFMRKYQVKYVIVPAEMIAKMQYIGSFLGASNLYYLISPYEGTKRIDGITADVYDRVYVLKIGAEIVPVYEESGKFYAIRKVYTRDNGKLIITKYSRSTLPFLAGEVKEEAYISKNDIQIPEISANFIIYIPPELQNTLLTSLMLLDGKGFESYKLIYSNSQVRIYRVYT